VSKGDIVLGVQFQGDVSELNRQISNIGRLTRDELKTLNQQLGGEVVKKLVIRTETDGSGAKKQVAEYKEFLNVVDSITSKQKQLDRVQQGSVTSLRQQVNEAKQARDQISKFETGIGRLGGQVNIVTDSWAKQNQKVQSLQRSLDLATASGFWDVAKTNLNAQGLFSFANGLVSITNGLQAASILIGQVSASINNLINALGDLQSFKLSFEAIGQGAGGAGLALAESSRIALGLGVDLKTVREGFQQLSPVVTKSGGKISDVSGIVEALSSRFAAFGISGDKARRVTNGIIQAFAKGKLMAEELTQQISEADPAFKTDFADAVGVSVAQLEELVKAGKITTDVLVKKLPKIGKSGLLFGRLGTSAADAAASLSTSGTTVDQVRAKINTINQLSLESFAKSIEPVLFAFVRLGAVITDSLSRLSKLQAIQSIGETFGSIGNSLVTIADFLLRVGENVIIAVGAIAQLLNILLKLPGVAELVAVAIAVKIASPLIGLKKTFLDSGAAAGGLGKAIRAATTFSGAGEFFGSLTNKAERSKEAIAGLKKESDAYARRTIRAAGATKRLQSKLAELEDKRTYLARPGQIQDPTSNPAIINQLRQVDKEAEKTRRSIERLKAAQSIYASSGKLPTVPGLPGEPLKPVQEKKPGPLASFKKGVGDAVSSIGPLEAALIGVTIVTAAYSTANEESNAILGESRQKVDALKQGILDLNGSTVGLESPVTGLGLVWEKFGYKVDAASRIFNGFSRESQQGVADLALAVTPPFGPILAFFPLLNQGAEGAALQTDKLRKRTTAATQAVKDEVQAALQLVSTAKALSTSGDPKNFLKIAAAIGQADTAAELLLAKTKSLNAVRLSLIERSKTQQKGTTEYAETQKQIATVTAEYEKQKSLYADLNKATSDFALSQGFLTGQQKQTAGTIKTLSEEIEGYKSSLAEGLNPNVNPEKWAEATGLIIGVQQKIDQINAKGATIAVRVIEQAGVGGVGGTLSQLDFYLQQLNTQKVSIPIGSSDISDVISKINYVNALQAAGARTNAQLERDLSQAYFDERSSKIRDEQNLRNQVFNTQIERLREPTPAERELQARRELELQAKAGGGDLEAQAQLERLQREKEITLITKQQQEADKKSALELKAIEDLQKAAQVAARAEELAAAREVLNARQAGLNLAEQMVPPAIQFATQMKEAATALQQMELSIGNIAKAKVNVTVTGIPGLWSGGPTVSGQTYQVNELGQEGFLSAGGHLSSINKPKNALWRAPSSGTVIPAHIWAGLDVPSGGVTANVRPMPAGPNNGGLQKLVRAIQSSLSRSSGSSESMHEMATIQARQAIEIGKLSRAVNRLADKDQTVNVAVRNTGTTAYLEAMNRRM